MQIHHNTLLLLLLGSVSAIDLGDIISDPNSFLYTVSDYSRPYSTDGSMSSFIKQYQNDPRGKSSSIIYTAGELGI